MLRVCIFCGRNDGQAHRLSSEDIWPNWLTQFVPRDLESYQSASILVNRDGHEKSERKIDGDPKSRRVKVVCKKCNNGWMSRLQEKAKDVLLPLIIGKPVVLGAEAQDLIAKWCAMSTMTADFIYPERQAISQEDRTLLFENHVVRPNTWRIWIGRYIRGRWPSYFIKLSLPYADDEITPSLLPSGRPRPNTQTTTLVFGELFVHAFSCPVPDLVAKVGITHQGAKKIAQIWPVREQFVAWPIVAMSDEDANRIAGAISERMSGIPVRWDGERRAVGTGNAPLAIK